MWAAWTVLFVCGVGLVRGATLKDKEPGVDTAGVQFQSGPERTRRSYFNWNNIADNVIKLAKMDLVQQGKTSISLPDEEEEDIVKFVFFEIPYRVHARQGSVGNLTSFRRSGDVITSSNESKETLQAAVPLTLDQLVVRYGDVNLRAIGQDISGQLEGTMDTVSFVMNLYGKEDGLGCTASLVGVKVTDVGKISAKITGLHDVFNTVLSSIVEFFLQAKYISVVSTIEEVLLQELSVILQEYDCDQLYSLFLLVGS